MDRRALYRGLGTGTLAVAGLAAGLAVVGLGLRQDLGMVASAACAVTFLIPGLYFLGYSRIFRSRELALAHVAEFASSRADLRVADLAEELHIPHPDAKRILEIAVREGRLRGRFEGSDRFVAEPKTPTPSEGET